MLFNTKVFVVFMLVVLAVYYRLGKDGKIWFLLGMSYLFYGFWNPWLCTLIAASSVVDWYCALRIEAAGEDKSARKRWLGVSLAMNLGALGFFKYYNFFVESLAVSMTAIGVPLDPDSFTLRVILPVGISFYTFQTLSYTIEVYKGNFKADKSLRDFALYVAFFPQLVAGPVERATHLLPQLKLDFKLDRDQVKEGVFLIMLGFVKKVVIGDRLANIIDPFFAEPIDNGAIGLMALLLFTTNIYVDFSAYSDIAIGLGRLLGYDIRANFNLPFVVPSIPERWRRWHISMGHWFRDYIYFPLGGSRHGTVRTQINIMIVMFLSGLWHGASWNFVVWGLLNGLTMVGHRVLLRPLRFLSGNAEKNFFTKWGYYYLCCWNTMLMISSINIFFRSDTFEVAKSYVTEIYTRSPWQFVDYALTADRLPHGFAEGFAFMGFVFLVHEAQRWGDIKARILRSNLAWASSSVAMYVYVLLYGIKGPEFIYFQF